MKSCPQSGAWFPNESTPTRSKGAAIIRHRERIRSSVQQYQWRRLRMRNASLTLWMTLRHAGASRPERIHEEGRPLLLSLRCCGAR